MFGLFGLSFRLSVLLSVDRGQAVGWPVGWSDGRSQSGWTCRETFLKALLRAALGESREMFSTKDCKRAKDNKTEAEARLATMYGDKGMAFDKQNCP